MLTTVVREGPPKATVVREGPPKESYNGSIETRSLNGISPLVVTIRGLIQIDWPEDPMGAKPWA